MFNRTGRVTDNEKPPRPVAPARGGWGTGAPVRSSLAFVGRRETGQLLVAAAHRVVQRLLGRLAIGRVARTKERIDLLERFVLGELALLPRPRARQRMELAEVALARFLKTLEETVTNETH